jgi:serine/threonine-protein kinase
LTVGTTFAGRYQVMELLGKGGMGRVYKAYDTEIKEHVALKILNPEIAADEGIIERFRNELKFARKISHRHVCRMFDLGRAEETTFISMEFVSGEDLKTLLRRIGQFTAKRAVAIVEQIADGLAEAHRLGVIHRDLKPQNIMIDRDGNTRIMDFGIARAVKGQGVTDTGVIIGTPDYMAPEQLEGQEADERSDIYALGAIFYEVLTGGPPFEGETPLIVAMKHKTEKPRDPRELNPQIPEGLSRVILRCLEKNRADRYQSAEDIIKELKGIEKTLPTTRGIAGEALKTRRAWYKKPLGLAAILAAVLAAAALGYLLFERRSQPAQPAPGKPAGTSAYKGSIAVLPFQDLSPAKDQEAFCTGITEDLITKLASVEQLKVISRTSAMRYRSRDKDIREIGKELGVETILEGSIQREKENIRVNVQLTNARDGSNIWGETYNRKVESIFTIQDEISKAIINALRIQLVAGQEYMLVKRYTQDPDAYNLYLEGRLNWNKRTEEGLKRSIELYQEAIAKDPKFALAYAGIADAYSFLGRMSLAPPKEVYPKAREAAEKALEMDDALAEGYIARGFVKCNHDWDWMGSEIDFNWAIGLNPNYASAYQYYGALLTSLGRFEEAMAKFEKAKELDPSSIPIRASIASLYYYSRQYDQAIERWREVQKMDPGINWVYYYLGLAYLQKGSTNKALKQFENAARLPGGSTLGTFGRACVYAATGRRDEAEAELQALVERSKQMYVPFYYMVVISAALGNKDRAFEYLAMSYAENDAEDLFLRFDPQLDPLRDDPRFNTWLEKMNLR